jgi:L-ascorbate metabolism protein UlaG (beta-lactamase superfamily)
MTITWAGGQNFSIKTKGVSVLLGEKVKLGDLEISEPGEYEVGGVELDWIDGITQVYLEGMNVGHIKKGKLLADDEMEKLNGIDILLIGVGGQEFSETKTALELISQIEPSIVVPMHNGNLDEFIKEEGGNPEGQDELKIVKADLQADARKVVVLNANR